MGRFSAQTRDFPFVAGRGLDAVAFNFVNDTDGHDLLVSYAHRPAVLHRDRLAGRYRAEPVDALPAGARSLVARDFDNDSRIDIASAGGSGLVVLLNRVSRWEPGQFTRAPARALAAAISRTALSRTWSSTARSYATRRSGGLPRPAPRCSTGPWR